MKAETIQSCIDSRLNLFDKPLIEAQRSYRRAIADQVEMMLRYFPICDDIKTPDGIEYYKALGYELCAEEVQFSGKTTYMVKVHGKIKASFIAKTKIGKSGMKFTVGPIKTIK